MGLAGRADGGPTSIGEPPGAEDDDGASVVILGRRYTTARFVASSGADWLLSEEDPLIVRWGTYSEVLWASGESMMLVGPPGVGKTTVAGQLLAALLGLEVTALGLPVRPAARVLYLAMDRPRQARRAILRQLASAPRRLLNERLCVWRGPIPDDLGRSPHALLALAMTNECDVVIIDSLKDAASKLSDEEAGGNVNRAIQLCNANGVDVLVLHHMRKSQNNSKPNKLDDLYGSGWLAAGTGSVLLLWGEAGAEIVDMVQLKPVLETVGPYKVRHDHLTGRSTILGRFDILAFVNAAPDGVTLTQVASARAGCTVKADSGAAKATARDLAEMVSAGRIRVERAGERSRRGTFVSTLYFPVSDETMDKAVTAVGVSAVG